MEPPASAGARINLTSLSSETANTNSGFSISGVSLLLAAYFYVALIAPMSSGSSEGGSEVATVADNLSQSNMVNQAVWIAFSVAGLAFIWRRFNAGWRLTFTTATIFLVAFLVLACLSANWAIAPDISTRRFVQQCLICFVFFVVAAFVQDKVRILNAVYLVLSVSIALNIMLFPVIGVGPIGYAGIFPQKNLLGAVAALALIFSMFNLVAPKASYKFASLFVALGSGALLIVSQSKTSLGLAIICPMIACVVVFLSRAMKVTYLIGLAIFLAVAGTASVLVLQIFGLSDSDVSMLLFNDTTFTGRTFIWDFSSSLIEQRPWLGWGYQSVWGIGAQAPNLKLVDSFISGLNQSHNGYLDIMLETGYVGFTVVVLLILSLFVAVDRAWRHRTDVSLLLLSILIFCVTHNLLESSLTRSYSPLWTFFLLVAGVSATIHQVPGLKRS